MRKLLWLMLFFVYPAYADFSSGQCNDLKSNEEFSVWFKLNPASGNDTVIAEKDGGNPQSVDIWTNSSTNAMINDTDTKPGLDYDVALTFVPGSPNKTGTLSYYLFENGRWDFIDSTFADFRDLNSANIVIEGQGDVSELQCSEDIELPEEVPEFSTNAKYEFGTQQCTSMPCTINFSQDYDLTPLVFLMPTVQTTSPDEDAPSRLLISSQLDENSTSVTFTQDSLPDLRDSYQTVPMTEISYFVIEPGTVTLDGHQLVAGYVETDKTYEKGGGGSRETVPYSRFGFDGFGSSPVVLHQLQTNNNDDAWMTSGRHHNGAQLEDVKLFIELSATGEDEFDDDKETIAFLSALPSSVLDVNNHQLQFGFFNFVRQRGVSSALLDGCQSSRATTDLSLITGIIGKKQQRLGGDGGWARRCELSASEATFVMDEDINNRGHIPELGGYLAFNKSLELPPVCDVTPYAVQSWDTNSELSWTSNTTAIQINGTYNRSGAIGIRLDPNNNIQGNDSQCDGNSCVESDLLYVASPDVITVNWPTNQNFQPGSGQHSLSDNQTYNTVTSSGGGTITLTGSSYRIEHLEIVAGSRMNLSQDTEIIVNTFTLTDSSTFNTNGHSLRIWAENNGSSKASVSVADSLNADVFSRDSVTVSSGSGVINGRVTAFDVTLTPDGKINNTDFSCPVETADYEVVLDPSVDIALTCEVITATATVYNNNVIDTSFNGTVTLSAGGNTIDTAIAQSGVATLSVSSTIVQELNAEASVTISGDDFVSNSATYEFVPARFDISPSSLDLIAGRPQDITIKPIQCDSNGTPISDPSYLGDADVSLSSVSYIHPSTVLNAVPVELLDRDSTWVSSPVSGTTTLPLTFTEIGGEVVASSQINYLEAGQVSFSITDERCISDEDGNELCQEFTGTKEVKSRPWTFAVCPPPSTNGTDGDSESGLGFMVAGGTFSLNAKPVIWDSSLDGTIDGEPIRLRQKSQNSAFCSLATTENFYVNDTATNATVSLDFSLATPTAGRAGNMTYDGEVDNFSTTTELEFTNVSVTEVGSFHFQVESNNTFYDAIEGGIDPGARELGRFFPRFFAISDQDWDYAGSQSFNYMNQNFEEVTFEVEAFSGGNTPASVENYQHFDTTLQSQFNLYDGVQPLRLVARSFGAGAWQGTGQSIGTFSATPSGDCGTSNLNSLCWVKADTAAGYEDGPYNLNGSTTNPTDIRISAVNNVDPVEFQTDADLLEQPDLRFGRVALDSAGTTTNATLNIPLRVELWDGERFVVNTTDSGMNVIVGESNVADNNVIWVEPGATAENLSLGDGGTVTNGESSSITVEHTTDVRQQVQIWLELDDTSNDFPWLQYQWDHSLSTEQDPSTVATFGIYRGNDRVIFRGEAGLIGQ